METIEAAYTVLLSASAVFLSLLLCACLVRAMLGPRFTDRVVSINVICTKTIIMIGILSCVFNNSSLLDIAIVYAMIAFLAVVVLSKCYIMPHHANPADMYFTHMADNFESEKKEELI
jgi:multicomponent Na+:H+ antiporter subunit F